MSRNGLDIVHRVGVRGASVDALYDALTTLEGLAAWWTLDTSGDPGTEGVLVFRFGGDDGFDMRVRTLVPAAQVVWDVVAGPEEWVGTEVVFDLHEDEDFAIVQFAHRGWREEVEFMSHCSTKWAAFLLSLVEYVGTGSGRPWPHELKVSNWK